MIVYNDDADLEVSDICVRNSLLSCVELSWVLLLRERESLFTKYIYITYTYQLLQWQAASEGISPS